MATRKRLGGQVYASDQFSDEFLKKLLNTPAKPIDGGKGWQEMFGVPKIPEANANTQSQVRAFHAGQAQGMLIAHHGGDLPKLGGRSRKDLANHEASGGAMGAIPPQLKNIPREDWRPHLEELIYRRK
tara:strand:- start:40 stop:423 length:384 start_codon:yes stop_codon:yes gene_type:complete